MVTNDPWHRTEKRTNLLRGECCLFPCLKSRDIRSTGLRAALAMFCTEGLCCRSSKQLRRGIDTQSSPLCYRLSRQPSSAAAHETGASQVWRKKLSQNSGSLQIRDSRFRCTHNRCRKRRRCWRVKSPAFCSVLLPNPKCNRQRQKSQSHDWQRFEVARLRGRFPNSRCTRKRRSSHEIVKPDQRLKDWNCRFRSERL